MGLVHWVRANPAAVRAGRARAERAKAGAGAGAKARAKAKVGAKVSDSNGGSSL
jgi:hypothetical protein